MRGWGMGSFASRRLAASADRGWYSGTGRWLRAAARETGRILFPSQCAACGRPGDALCEACLGDVLASLVRPRVVDDLSEFDVLAPRESAPVVSAGAYGGRLAAALLEAKRQHGRPLVLRLAPALARALRAAALAACPREATGRRWVVPVPASGPSLRRRGFWPVGEALRAAGVPPGWERSDALVWVPPLLRPGGVGRWSTLAAAGGGASQKARGRRERSLAVRGTFAVSRSVDPLGAAVLLVDDVVTSGATLAECARVLRRAGATVVGAAVVAHVRAPVGDCAHG